MAYRVRLFADFWNYQLQWNDRVAGHQSCDWRRLPEAFVRSAQQQLATAGVDEPLRLEETRVYASYNPSSPGDTALRGWFHNFLDRQPSFRVFTMERKDKPAHMYCRSCQHNIATCPNCGSALTRSREKGVDTAIVTDLLSLAWEDAYDVAILISSDADMIPAVQRVQEKGLKVINAMWAPLGSDLARECWASFDINGICDSLIRR
ncbi:MAG: NYN domain-containing protein [Armatimonadia bacterium]